MLLGLQVIGVHFRKIGHAGRVEGGGKDAYSYCSMRQGAGQQRAAVDDKGQRRDVAGDGAGFATEAAWSRKGDAGSETQTLVRPEAPSGRDCACRAGCVVASVKSKVPGKQKAIKERGEFHSFQTHTLFQNRSPFLHKIFHLHRGKSQVYGKQSD